MSEKIRVCVIGAGPAGCSALRQLTTESDKFDAVAYERNLVPGGVWAYTDRTGEDETGLPVHTSMYNKLKLNNPKELTEFKGFPHPKEWKSYITREQCLQYVNDFIDHFDIRKNIKTHTIVVGVSQLEIPGSDKVKWNVEISDTRKMHEIQTEVFDAVIVCIGHDWNEYIPQIPGMKEFQGIVLHSRNYRHAELFEGLNVAILGGNFSGQDIAMQISKYAKKVFVCHERSNFPPSFPKHIDQHPPFVRMTKNSIVFPNEREIKIDAVIFCTGYRYSFPFLKDGIVNIDEERVMPVYKHMVHINYTNLIFFNLPRQLLYFLHFDAFAKFAVRVIDGRVKLPSKEDMLKDSDDDFQRRIQEGLKMRYAHHMGLGDRQWLFNADLARIGGFEPLPPILQKFWHDVKDEKYMNLTQYTELEYEITGDNSYKILNPEGSKTRYSFASA